MDLAQIWSFNQMQLERNRQKHISGPDNQAIPKKCTLVGQTIDIRELQQGVKVKKLEKTL